MLDAILGLFSGGGAVGILGAAVSHVVDFFKSKQKHNQAIELAAIEREAMREEAELNIRVSAIELEGKRDLSASSDLTASYLHDSRLSAENSESFLFLAADFLRASVRPVVTYFLVFCVFFIAWKLFGIIGGLENVLPVDDAKNMLLTVIDSILYTAQVVIFWWFGTRVKLTK